MKFFTLKILFLALVVCSIQAQENSIVEKYNGKIAKADKKIKKGDLIVSKKEKYTKQIDEIEASGASRKGKVKRLKTKANKIIIQSASHYKEGYGKKYNAYKKAAVNGAKSGLLESGASEFINTARSDFRLGRKLRRKSSNQSNVDKAVDYLLEANDKENQAIENLVKAVGLKNVIEEPVVEMELVSDSIPEQQDTLATVLETELTLPVATDTIAYEQQVDSTQLLLASDTLTLESDSTLMVSDTIQTMPLAVEPVVEELPVNEIPKLYFSVQFLADKQAIPKEKIRSIYDGPFEVVKHEADGWFRYSFGKFKTLEEANEMKTNSGVDGYVVAYFNEERISTRRAVDMLSNEN